MKNFKETEIKVEREKELLLSLMSKVVAAQEKSFCQASGMSISWKKKAVPSENSSNS
ncbi:hypothetical protein ACTZ92_002530 [Vibrio alginolyticus]